MPTPVTPATPGPIVDIEQHFIPSHTYENVLRSLAAEQGRVLMSQGSVPHPDYEFELLRNSFLRLFEGDEPYLQADLLTDVLDPGLENSLRAGAFVGDVDGDGFRDVVGSDGRYGPGAILFSGPLEMGSPASIVGFPGANAVALPDAVGGRFVACDLNGDGLGDLCSTGGFATSPAPYSDAAALAQGAETLTFVDLSWFRGVIVSVVEPGALHLIPSSALPASAAIENLTTATVSLDGFILEQLLTGSPNSGPELVVLESQQDFESSLIGLSLDGSFEERYRLSLGPIYNSRFDLESGDWNGDGIADVAVALNQTIAVYLGPLGPGSAPVVTWTTPEPSASDRIGFQIASDGSTLWVAEAANNRIYRIDDPHLPR